MLQKMQLCATVHKGIVTHGDLSSRKEQLVVKVQQHPQPTAACAWSMCVTLRRQNKPSNTQEERAVNPAEDNRKKQCERNETKPNAITINPRNRHNNPTHSLTPCARVHPAIRTPAMQYACMQSQTVTTCRGCGCNVMHKAPRELPAHRGISITAELPIEWTAKCPG